MATIEEIDAAIAKKERLAAIDARIAELEKSAATTQTQEKSLADRAVGGVSAALTAGSDLFGGAVGGLTALVDEFNPMTNNSHQATIDNIRSKFRIPPTESAEAAFSAMDRTMEPIKPILDWVDSFKKKAGNQAIDATNSPAFATFTQLLPDIALELSAIGRASKIPESGKFSLESANNAKSEINTAKSAEDAASNTGIDLFKAQKTLNPTDLERQSFVAQLPSGAVKARESLSRQNSQALEAVDNVLSRISSAESTGNASFVFRDAAQKAVDKKVSARREAASPIYKQAFRRQREGNLDLINTDKIYTKTTEMSKQFDQNGQVAKSLNMAAKKIKDAGGDLQKLHNAKIEIDQVIDSFGEGAVGNTTKRYLADVVRDLTENLTSQSPSYRAAKSEFERMSPPVNKIKDSQIGKIADMDDVQLKGVAQRIFDPAETNPKVIVSARDAIKEVDPAAWEAITRAEIERRMGRIRADIGSPNNIQSVENIPSQLYNSIFGNKKSKDVLYAAVDPETKSNLQYLETALKRASTGRPGGSQTGIRSEISKELRGGVTQSIRDFIRTPISKTASVGEDAMFESRVRSLSSVLFDPSWRVEMKELKKLNSESATAKEMMDKILAASLAASPAVINEKEETK